MQLKTVKDKMLLSTRRRAAGQYKNKPFDSEYFDLFYASTSLKYVFSGVSFITGFFYVRSLFQDQINGTLISVILALLVLFSLEIIKYSLTPKAFNRAYKKRWTEALLLFLIVLPIYTTSVLFSIKGVETLFSRVEAQKVNTEQLYNLKLDSTNSVYENKLEVEQAKLTKIIDEATEKNTMHWKTTVDQIDRIESRIDNIEAQRIQQITYLTDTKVEQVKNKMDFEVNRIKKLIYIGFVTELLLLICFMFNQYYLFKSYEGYKTFRRFNKNTN